jgi:hypothetical protein
MHSAMGKDSTDRQSGTPAVYQIKMEGVLDEKWSDWFNGMSIAFERTGDGPPITTITGAVADQAKLRGMLSKIWDLNLTLISVTRLESEKDNSHS